MVIDRLTWKLWAHSDNSMRKTSRITNAKRLSQNSVVHSGSADSYEGITSPMAIQETLELLLEIRVRQKKKKIYSRKSGARPLTACLSVPDATAPNAFGFLR